MAELDFPYLSTALAVWLGAAAAVWIAPLRARQWIAGGGALINLLLASRILNLTLASGQNITKPLADGWFQVDGINAWPIVLVAGLTLILTLALSQAELRNRQAEALLLVAAAVHTTYAATEPWLLCVGWTASFLPLLLFRGNPTPGHRYRGRVPIALAMGASSISLAVAVALIPSTGETTRMWAFAFFMVAVAVRSGLFPLHTWIIGAMDGPLALPSTLAVVSQLGAFLVARLVVTGFGPIARETFPTMTGLALVTALAAAVMAVAANPPRRVIGFLIVSQSVSVLTGLEEGSAEAVSGAMALWTVLALAGAGLVIVQRAIEALFTVDWNAKYLGLAGPAPRFAAFFAIFGFAAVGLPGTLGFVAEDLLLHGTMEVHPWIGWAMPIATALNAIAIFRLFARLFLGRQWNPELRADAVGQKRWALSGLAVLLILGALMPKILISWQAPAARQLSDAGSQNIPLIARD